MSTEARYLVWSEEHGAFWGRARMGYTRSLVEAGRYTESEALRIVEEANKYHDPAWSGRPFSEVAIPDPLERE